MDFYRLAEVPRIVDNDGETYRVLAGLRGTIGTDWDWDSAVLWSESKKDEVTRNRFSNTLLQEALNDPTPAAYNPFGGGVNTNYERAAVDVYRNSEADLKLVDFRISNIGLFDLWAGPVGFVAGAEYREESFKDDRDPRLDGTIVFTDWQGDTYPFVSDVVNSSPTPDNSGSRDVTSLYAEFAVPLLATLDLQLALRYEDFSDVGSTTVPKIAFGWRPTNWFMLRGSWSEAFRAPNLITVNETIIARNNTNKDWLCQYLKDTTGMDDGLDGNCEYSWQRRAQGSEDLKPEKSDNTSIGVVFTPTENLTLTLDFWKIEKEDTIGLFGQDNIALEDLLFRVQAGDSNCGSVIGSPDLSRSDDVDDDALPLFEMAGICPVGEAIFNDDRYANLDTRKVEGYDFGVYYDVASRMGDWTFTWVGSVYTKYDQTPGDRARVITDAQAAGIIPDNYPVAGLGDLIERNGNQETKMNARVRWRKGDWAASVAWFYLSDFYDADLTLLDGTRYVIPDHSYMNASVDYNFDIGPTDTRVRFGINNLTNERAPLADGYFGYWSDAHSDYGRHYYVDVHVRF
jgi:outer membrane receptor protein involved in Fe transport